MKRVYGFKNRAVFGDLDKYSFSGEVEAETREQRVEEVESV